MSVGNGESHIPDEFFTFFLGAQESKCPTYIRHPKKPAPHGTNGLYKTDKPPDSYSRSNTFVRISAQQVRICSSVIVSGGEIRNAVSQNRNQSDR